MQDYKTEYKRWLNSSAIDEKPAPSFFPLRITKRSRKTDFIPSSNSERPVCAAFSVPAQTE